ncbi:alpha/beta hydrolase family protein [Nocardia veterana]|uniref:Prolyl oligopeptidase family serine peptidase n=1 Tax=Nocardia veterana TaxID=132249 RepID=A0A7X6RHI9_9NOCA|nr:alpha/beta hydrolase [Nocardia veterana]NKY86242.1 prolyl oligopeptidase family serine peptidase [Nocardia veterana]
MWSPRSISSDSPDITGPGRDRPRPPRRAGTAAGLVVLLILAAACSRSEPVQSAPKPPVVTGDWNGVLPAPDQALPIGIGFDGNGAAVTIPPQGIYDHPLDRVVTEPDAIAFAIPGLPGDPNFHGRYHRDDDTIAGTFTQAGHDLPLTLHRGPVPTPARSQEPHPPWPYRSEDVHYRSGQVPIAGTLTLPNGRGPHPAVVLISGSGPQDRNEEIAGHKPFLLLADTLTRAGYAVLRTDDRGVGGTGGQLDTCDYTDLTDDIAAGLAYLRSRGDIDGTRIGLLGHSEGGYLAPLAATRPDSRVAFVIMAAGPAVSGSEVLLGQNEAMLRHNHADAEEIRDRVGYITTLTTLIRSGDREQVRRFAAAHNDALPPDQRQPQSALDQLTTPYFDALIDYDPAPAQRALRIPVLALYGTKDLQVPAAQSAPAARANLAADPYADVHVFDGLNHLMQPADTGDPKEYSTIDITIAPEVLTYLTTWLGAAAAPAR